MNSRSPRSLSLRQSLQLACYSPKVVVLTNPVHLVKADVAAVLV
jgi:hypothetical protein